MATDEAEEANLRLAQAWCVARGSGWSVRDKAGRGGTAPVFTIESPEGLRALKLYDAKFSEGELGKESRARLKPQVELGLHECPFLVRIHDGGEFQDRLYLLMDKAPGNELEKQLDKVPRDKIRQIVSQVAKACIFLRERSLCHRDIKSANIFISDDFERVTLLDLSVLRDVHDPVGLGTDHGGELPVVATSRYSPPEYLFRLIPPDTNLWHALDIYQLGGLLHDLIMREPMFEQEYRKTRDTNRYRFAWIVATQEPTVSAPDVDADLVLLARRALDKDWQRRSQLQLEDFLDDAQTRRTSGLAALGLAPRSSGSVPARAAVQKRMGQICDAVEAEVASRLRTAGITATHRTQKGAADEERSLTFAWEPPNQGGDLALSDIDLTVMLRRSGTSGEAELAIGIELTAKLDRDTRSTSLNLPTIKDDEDTPPTAEISTAILGVLGELGSTLLRAAKA